MENEQKKIYIVSQAWNAELDNTIASLIYFRLTI